ncbi:Six-hairpin glycosidase-like protein [Echria macrotheca]|uniref:Six-hairpin glycosidase-like protein n=1 Tax=Echria macrotheca TaxID=438768 RepID=A0AAJ0BIK5_9PEZI|nr:Six-hairpin glycosidase-like protein [Echria macrotheca]
MHLPSGLVALLAAAAVAAAGDQPATSASNKWRIWDDQPGASNTFAEYYPLGNGRLGIMMSGDPRTEKVQLNENSFWSGGGPLWRVNPDALWTVGEMRRLIRQGKFAEAEDLGLMGYTGTPLSTRHYDKMGNVKMTQLLPDGQVTGYERWLGVDDAVGGVRFAVGNVTFEREYLSSYPDDIVAIRIRGSRPGSVSIRVRLDRGADLNRYEGYSEPSGGHSTVMGGQSMDANPLLWAAGARIVSATGKVSTLGDTVRCEGADEAIVLIQAWTSYRKPDPKKAVLADLAAVSKGFDDIKKAHLADYQKYYQRVSLDLGRSTAQQTARNTSGRMLAQSPETFDPELAALFFQYGRYLLIATSRPTLPGQPDTSLPPNLQGIWNDQYNPMWGSKYTVNINLQMNYWPMLVTGLSDLVAPLNNLLKTMHREGEKVAAQMYNLSGTVTHHNTDMWGDSAPQDNYSPGTFWAMGATWMATHIIEHYRFTGDKTLLRDMFPTLKAVAEFALGFLVEQDGYMVTSPSLSPENTFLIPGGKGGASAAVTAGPTIDNQLLSELFGFIPEAQTALGISDAAFAERVTKMRARLPPLRLNQYGGIAEWMADYDEANPGNGHVSHLVPLYPLNHITSSNRTLFTAALTSLQHRIANGGAPCGWPRVWAIGLSARLFREDIVHQRLATQMSECSWNRTMLNMGGAAPFQIDGSLGVTGVLAEVFVQSHELVSEARGNGSSSAVVLQAKGTGDAEAAPLIRLLPSLPKEWGMNGGGEVKGLVARGGFTVDVSWDGKGVMKAASVVSGNGNVAYVTLGRAAVGAARNGTVIRADGAGSGVFLRLDGKKGTAYNITMV